MSSEFILEVKDLRVEFDTYGGIVQAVRGASFQLREGKTLAIVGESGCGKSVTVQSLMGLIPIPPGRITGGSVKFRGKEILGEALKTKNSFRGRDISMIFQDPMTSLNPTMTIGKQIAESLIVHEGLTNEQGRARALELLEQVKIPEAKNRLDAYPFQFSGGMRQRVMIAMALASNPSVLIADEPTTALDVTIQAQILNLLQDLQRDRKMSLILITHDLGVVARVADDVCVMYGGQVVESGPSEDIFYRSAHPYTLGLRAAMPKRESQLRTRLQPIEGSPPDLFNPPKGCSYFARCPYAMAVCKDHDSPQWGVSPDHKARCWLHDERSGPSPVRNKQVNV